jgi:hypothetical protein
VCVHCFPNVCSVCMDLSLKERGPWSQKGPQLKTKDQNSSLESMQTYTNRFQKRDVMHLYQHIATSKTEKEYRQVCDS